MSIYATIFDIGAEHKPRCSRMKKIGHKMYECDDSKLCTCGASPLLYKESHVLPSNRDKRGGCVMLAGIPSHITRNGRDNGAEGQWHPWLRLSVFNPGSDSIVLTRKQAEKMRDAMQQWLDRSRVRGRLR